MLTRNGRLVSHPLPDELRKTLRLELDVEDPGEAGAAVRVGWSGACEAAATSANIQGKATISPPDCRERGERRLWVEFSNDQWIPNRVDRNLIVRLLPSAT